MWGMGCDMHKDSTYKSLLPKCLSDIYTILWEVRKALDQLQISKRTKNKAHAVTVTDRWL
jgi:hypothetical protein